MGVGPINVNQTAVTDPNEGFIRRVIHDFSLCSRCHISTLELEWQEPKCSSLVLSITIRFFLQLISPTERIIFYNEYKNKDKAESNVSWCLLDC